VLWAFIAIVLFGTLVSQPMAPSQYFAFLIILAAASGLLVFGLLLLRSAKRQRLNEGKAAGHAISPMSDVQIGSTPGGRAVAFSGSWNSGDIVRARLILSSKAQWIVMVVIFVTVLMTTPGWPEPAVGLPSNFMTVVMPWLILLLFLSVSVAFSVRAWLRGGGTQTLRGSADAQGLSMSTETSQLLFHWGYWSRVRITRDAVILQSGNGEPGIFKRDWFRSGEEWEQFLDLVRTHVRSQ
jgi:NADH:ubiquinone oxidoreductase subunit 3 (subunit A)